MTDPIEKIIANALESDVSITYMQFSAQEIADLLEAIEDAQNELCVDLKGDRFPEGTAYYRRLEALAARLTIALDDQT